MAQSYLARQLSEPQASSGDGSQQNKRGLPTSWYNSDQMYGLERRAIFSRKWMLITHKSRVEKPGDFLRYEIAGFDFVVTKDRDNRIHGFHNACRHRAFPVVQEERGSVRIFSCKYHGWSYGLNGKLAKAPGYQDLPTFDKSVNSLLPIHTHVDQRGFVWVNLEGKPTPEISWEEDFNEAHIESRFSGVDFDDYTYDHTWEHSGAHNWKLLADPFNELFHSHTTSESAPTQSDTEYSLDTVANTITHNSSSQSEQTGEPTLIPTTYQFPNASMSVTPAYFFIQHLIPLSPTKTTLKYEVYLHNSAPPSSLDRFKQIYEQTPLPTSTKNLATLTPPNLNHQAPSDTSTNPELEKASVYFQTLIRDEVTQHWRREQQEGREIWPAAPPVRVDEESEGKDDIDFCTGLACAPTGSAAGLVW